MCMNKISSILALFAVKNQLFYTHTHTPEAPDVLPLNNWNISLELNQHCSVHIVPLYKVLKKHCGRFAVNEIIRWFIEWWLSISDEHLLLKSRITEGKRNKNRKKRRDKQKQELQLTFSHSFRWNKLKMLFRVDLFLNILMIVTIVEVCIMCDYV